jgi:hypothetical protein
MGFLSKMFFGGGGSAVKDVAEGVGSLAKDLRTAITGELPPDKRAEFESKVLDIESRAMDMQAKINMEEAKSSSLFIAGWRPFIGWVGGLALAYHYIVSPLILWGLTLYYGENMPNLPEFDIVSLFPIVFAMLGIGTMRSYEKSKDLHNKH